MTKSSFKLFPKKLSELPLFGFAKHPCIKVVFLQLLESITDKIKVFLPNWLLYLII